MRGGIARLRLGPLGKTVVILASMTLSMQVEQEAAAHWGWLVCELSSQPRKSSPGFVAHLLSLIFGFLCRLAPAMGLGDDHWRGAPDRGGA